MRRRTHGRKEKRWRRRLGSRGREEARGAMAPSGAAVLFAARGRAGRERHGGGGWPLHGKPVSVQRFRGQALRRRASTPTCAKMGGSKETTDGAQNGQIEEDGFSVRQSGWEMKPSVEAQNNRTTEKFLLRLLQRRPWQLKAAPHSGWRTGPRFLMNRVQANHEWIPAPVDSAADPASSKLRRSIEAATTRFLAS